MFKLSKGFYLTLLSSFFWALLIFFTKLLLNSGENEFNLIFWMTIFSLPFWISMLYREKNEIKTINKKGIFVLILISLIITIGVSILDVLATKNTQATNYAFLIRIIIVFTIIFDFIIFKTPITLKKVLLAIFILAGTYLFVSNGQLIKLNFGDILTILEAFILSIGGNILGKYITGLISPNMSAIGSFFFGFIPLIIICFIFGKIAFPLNIGLILILTIISVSFTLIEYRARKATSATSFTMIISITPLWVTFLAVLFLGESVSLLQSIGGLLIMSSVFVVEKLKI